MFSNKINIFLVKLLVIAVAMKNLQGYQAKDTKRANGDSNKITIEEVLEKRIGDDKSYKNSSDSSLSVIPVGGVVNSSKGEVELKWNSIPGAKGYKLGIFNGLEYEYIDVGNVTSYTTKGKNIWPTTIQIQSGIRNIITDGTGQDLSDNPAVLYSAQKDSTYKEDSNYYFIIYAYDEYGIDCGKTNYVKTRLPDRTKPLPVINLNTSLSNVPLNTANKGKVKLSWIHSEITDLDGFDLYYKKKSDLSTWSDYVKINTAKIESTVTSYEVGNLLDFTDYKFYIKAYDKSGNYSDLTSSSLITTYDRTPPYIGLIPMLIGYQKGEEFEVSFSDLKDGSGIKRIDFTLPDNSVQSIMPTNREATIKTKGIGSGLHFIKMTVTDVFGNYSVLDLPYKKDVTMPKVSLNPLGLLEGDYFGGIMTIKVGINDEYSGIRGWKLSCIDLQGDANPIEIASGAVRTTTTINYDSRNLVDGKTYKLVLEARDVVGNYSKKEFKFIKSY